MKRISVFLLLIITIASCRVEEKIVDGNRAFERKQFANAIPLLKKEFNKSKSTTEKGQKAFMIGESYRIINQPEPSKEWYMKAYNYNYGEEALRQYALALKETEDYGEAIQAFKNLGADIGDPYEYQREIVACRQANSWLKNQKNENTDVDQVKGNSSAAEYYPTIYKGNKLIIISDRSEATGDKTYGWTGNKFSDLFIVDLDNGDVENFSPVLNSEFNEGPITFNKDFSAAYFTRCGEKKIEGEIAYCKLMYSELIGDQWSEPQVLEFTEDQVNYSHPFLAEDGNTLYFSSDHPEGFGEKDIYVVKKTSEGWGEPKNLGPAINTEGTEISPAIYKDTLYFSSNYHIGMGGVDIFKTVKNGYRWGPLQNLRAPINSGADDFGIRIDYSKKSDDKIVRSGYFTSNRKKGKGNDDIYQFEKRVPPPPKDPVEPVDTPLANTNPTEPVKPVEPKIVYKFLLEGKVVEKVLSNPDDPNSRITGKAPIPNATVQVNFRDTSYFVTTDNKGEFKLEVEEQETYLFTVSKTDYLTKDRRFSTRGIEKDPTNPIQTFYEEIVLDKIFKNVEIKLEGIYYDTDEYYIRPDAKPVLNELADILKRNPDLRVELGSHTDCVGRDGYNQVLSENRAKSAVEYLTKRGISSDRLIYVGYGESQPAVDCQCSKCTPDENQLNRRTTFKIIE